MSVSSSVTKVKRTLPVMPHVASGWASFPKMLAISSLFTMVPRGRNIERGSLECRVAGVNHNKGCTISHRGQALDADHQGVVLVLFKLSEGIGIVRGSSFIEIEFQYSEALALLGKAYVGSARTWLRGMLRELSAHHIEITNCLTSKTIFSGSLISWRDTAEDTAGFTARSRLKVSISGKILELYAGGYGKVNLAQRKLLGSSHLARLMQVELACQPEHHHPYLVSTYQKLFGSKSSLESFKRELEKVLNRLQEVGVVSSWELKASQQGSYNPLVVVTAPERPKKAKRTPKFGRVAIRTTSTSQPRLSF